MAAVMVQIADALVEALNLPEFSEDFTAVRRYRPIYKLSELETLRVTVVPHGIALERASRSNHQTDYQLDIGVQQRVGVEDAAEEASDELMALVEEIADFCISLSLQEPHAICTAVVNDPIYAPDHLEDLHCFTSVLTLTFRLWR